MRSPRLSLVLYLLFAAQQTIAGPLKVAGRGSGPSNTTSGDGGQNATPTKIGLPVAGNLTSTRSAAITPHPQFQTLTGASIDIPESLLTETLSENVLELKTVTLVPIDETTTRQANRTKTSSIPDASPTIPSHNTTVTLPSNSSHRTTSDRLTPTKAAPGITSLETQASPRPTHNATLTLPEARPRNSTVIVTAPSASSASESSRQGSLTATTTTPSVFVPPLPTLPANQTRPANHTHATRTSKITSSASITTTSHASITFTSTSTTTTSATRTEPYYVTSEIPKPITVANPQSTLAPKDVYQHNLDQARRFNTLYGGLAAGSLCTAGQVACIDGKIATCPATGAQFALSSCGWSNLQCFVLPLNNTEGVVIGCSDVAEAEKILAPSVSSTTTSILPFLTTAFQTPVTTPPPPPPPPTTTQTQTQTAKNTTTATQTAVTLTSVVVVSDLPPVTGLEPTSRPTMTLRTNSTTSTTHHTSMAATSPSSTLSTTITSHNTTTMTTLSSTLSSTRPSHNSTTATSVHPKVTTTGVILRPIPDGPNPLASGLLKKVIVAPQQTVPIFFTVTVTNEHYVTVTVAPGV